MEESRRIQDKDENVPQLLLAIIYEKSTGSLIDYSIDRSEYLVIAILMDTLTSKVTVLLHPLTPPGSCEGHPNIPNFDEVFGCSTILQSWFLCQKA